MKYLDKAATENGVPPKEEDMTEEDTVECFEAGKSALSVRPNLGQRKSLEDLALETAMRCLLPRRK